MAEQNEQIESVRRNLLDAFPDSPGDDSSQVAHEDCVEIRCGMLASIREEDLPFVLKHVLIDLLDTHTNDAGNSKWVDMVIQYLDVEGVIKESVLGLNDEDFGLLAKEFQERGLDPEAIKGKLAFIRKLDRVHDPGARKREYLERIKLFSKFTAKQARAIYEWLDVAQYWEDLSMNEDDVKSAMAYWGKRYRLLNETKEG